MFPSLIRLSAPAVEQQILKLIPPERVPSLATGPANLYEVLSRTADGGVGKEVHQIRWSHKHISDSWWKVTRTKFKSEGKHGKAWGQLYWKGEYHRIGLLNFDQSHSQANVLAPRKRESLAP